VPERRGGVFFCHRHKHRSRSVLAAEAGPKLYALIPATCRHTGALRACACLGGPSATGSLGDKGWRALDWLRYTC
jgi:hypothetical protein